MSHLSYVSAKIKGTIQDFNVFLVSVPFLCTNCALKTKELLRNFYYYNLIIGGPEIRNFFN